MSNGDRLITGDDMKAWADDALAEIHKAIEAAAQARKLSVTRPLDYMNIILEMVDHINELNRIHTQMRDTIVAHNRRRGGDTSL